MEKAGEWRVAFHLFNAMHCAAWRQIEIKAAAHMANGFRQALRLLTLVEIAIKERLNAKHTLLVLPSGNPAALPHGNLT